MAIDVLTPFSEEQLALADVAGDLFRSVNPPERLRAVWAADGERVDDAWSRIAAVGLTAIGVPEAHGGMGGGLRDLVLVCEEAGVAALPEPLVDGVVVAPPLLAALGTAAQCERWLPMVATGEARAAVRLPGQAHVLDADTADVLLLWDGRAMVLCEPDEVTCSRRPSEDRSRRIFAVTIGGGTSLPDEVGAVEAAVDRARVVTAAVLDGVGRRLVAMAVEHATVREQFGVPIGSFQAVQHLLADLHVEVETSRATAWAAARAVDDGAADASRLARVAKAAAAVAGTRVNTEVLQVFGGIGFTWEHDLHLWLKRGLALAAEHGVAREHHRALGRSLLEGVR